MIFSRSGRKRKDYHFVLALSNHKPLDVQVMFMRLCDSSAPYALLNVLPAATIAAWAQAKRLSHFARFVKSQNLFLSNEFATHTHFSHCRMCSPKPFPCFGHKREDYHSLLALSNRQPVVYQASLRLMHVPCVVECAAQNHSHVFRHKQEGYHTLPASSKLQPCFFQQVLQFTRTLACFNVQVRKRHCVPDATTKVITVAPHRQISSFPN